MAWWRGSAERARPGTRTAAWNATSSVVFTIAPICSKISLSQARTMAR
jgi:hypothetical protein